MKGLLLSEQYYLAVGKEMIANKFAAYKERVAVGLVGHGSECFGFDDEISQDHDWGPGFCIWLEQKDFDSIGSSLSKAYDSLPNTFMGYRRLESAWSSIRIGVMSIDSFYSTFIGSPNAPETPERWLAVPSANLAACTNGKVFNDPLGAFSAVRKKIEDYYPEDVRLKKIAAKCMSTAQSGQYNYARCVKRRSHFAAQYALSSFCKDALYLVFLLNRRYMPFYKWACKAAQNLPEPGPKIAETVNNLNKQGGHSSLISSIEEIITDLIKTLRSQGLSDSKSGFLLDHGPRVHSLIKHSKLKEIDMWWGGADAQ